MVAQSNNGSNSKWAWNQPAEQQRRLGWGLLVLGFFLVLDMTAARASHEIWIFQGAGIVFFLAGAFYVFRSKRLSH